MTEQGHDPGRRQVLAAAVLPGLERLLQPLTRKPDSYTEWFSAIQMDDATRCQQLLQRGFDPNTVEPERFDTGLILAVRIKSWKVFNLLLKARGTQLDARSRNGDTALMVASFNGEAAAASSLIDQGAEINRPGWTALHYAAASGSLTIIRKLLMHSAYIDAESPNKTTPLMMAARAGHDKAVLLLLEEGADVLLKNELGLDAIDFARSQQRTEIVRLLQRWQSKAIAAQRPEGSASPASDASETEAEDVPDSTSAETHETKHGDAANEQAAPAARKAGHVSYPSSITNPPDNSKD